MSNVLPYYTLIIAGAALAHPPAFAWIGKEWWSVALTAIMVSVGINLEFKVQRRSRSRALVRSAREQALALSVAYSLSVFLSLARPCARVPMRTRWL